VIGRPALGIPAPLCPSLTLGARPDVFVQAHGEMTESLVRAGLGAAGDLAGAEVLELFSGHGAFTFALAAAARAVTAVESSGPALQLARKTAAEGGVTNVRFVQGDALKVAKGLADEKRGFDVLLADPPRTGATGIAPVAAALGVPRLVYVACSASSLARDAAALRGCGYVPQTLQLVEMFPQTRHVEAVMAFQRLSPP
jgi:23S rRNA (uracil1939-C5)-methyltransferase